MKSITISSLHFCITRISFEKGSRSEILKVKPPDDQRNISLSQVLSKRHMSLRIPKGCWKTRPHYKQRPWSSFWKTNI